jgi:predicted nucleic acid-binding protein
LAKRIYLDANAIIKAVEGADEGAAPIGLVLISGSADCISSELTLAEALVGVWKVAARDAPDEWLAAGYERLFAPASPLRVVPVERDTLRRAARLRAADLSLKLPDAIHLATALIAGCSTFVSGDRKLLSAAAREGLSVVSIDPADLEALLAGISAP